MATNTVNYNLKKPSQEDFYNVEDHNGNMDIIDSQLKARETEIQAVQEELDGHLGDYTMQIPWGGTTTNIGNTYSIANPVISTLVPGMAVSFICNADATGAVSLNWNGKGAKSVLKANGSAVTNWKNGGVYTVRYDGVNFRLQGEEGVIPKLPNLIKNGGFENGLNCWYTPHSESILSINTVYKKYGLNSVDLYIPSTMNEGFLMQDNIKYVQGHKYYVCYWVLSSVAGKLSSVYFPASGTYPVSPLIECTNAYTWYFNSFISADSSMVSGDYPIRIDNDNNCKDVSMTFDGIMIIDLTDAFGTGNEPDKTEMDYKIQTEGWWDSDLQQLTFDSTAIAADIEQNKIAYANGQKLIGTSTKKQWQSGTVVSSDSGGGNYNCIVGSLPFTPKIAVWWANKVDGNCVGEGGFGVSENDPELPDMVYYDSNYARTYKTSGFRGRNYSFLTRTEDRANITFGTDYISFFTGRLGESYSYIIIG